MAVLKVSTCACGHERLLHVPVGCTVCDCEMRAPHQKVKEDGTVAESWTGFRGTSPQHPPFEPGNQISRTHGISALLGRHPGDVSAATLEAIQLRYESFIEEYPYLYDADAGELRRLAMVDFQVEVLAQYGLDVLAGMKRVIIPGAPKTAPKTGVEAWFASGLPETLSKQVQRASNISRNLGLNPAGRYAIAKDLYTARRLANEQGVSDLIARGRKRLGESA